MSMLEDDEAAELGLALEGDAARRTGLIFVNFPIGSRRSSGQATFEEFLEKP